MKNSATLAIAKHKVEKIILQSKFKPTNEFMQQSWEMLGRVHTPSTAAAHTSQAPSSSSDSRAQREIEISPHVESFDDFITGRFHHMRAPDSTSVHAIASRDGPYSKKENSGQRRGSCSQLELLDIADSFMSSELARSLNLQCGDEQGQGGSSVLGMGSPYKYKKKNDGRDWSWEVVK